MSNSRKFYDSPKFKALDATWDQKLKDSGFEDIEDKEFDRLKAWSTTLARLHPSPEVNAAKSDYYSLAGEFLHSHPFSSPIEKRIWALHSEGIGIREIYSTINEPEATGARTKIHQTIQKLQQLLRLFANAR